MSSYRSTVSLTSAEYKRSMPAFACIVLAAGRGTRFGGPKLTAALPDGTSFADAVTRTAVTCGADPVAVVVPPGHVASPGTIQVENPDPASDQIASVRLGLARLANSAVDGVLLWPVDCPLVRPDTVAAIVDAAHSDGAAIVIPSFAGRQGHPTWFAAEVWPELMLAEEDGARQVVRRDPTRVQRVAVNDAAVLADIDTREDLARALAGRSAAGAA